MMKSFEVMIKCALVTSARGELVASDFHAVIEAEIHLERPRLLFVGDLLGGEELAGLSDCRVRCRKAVNFGDDVFNFVVRFHVDTLNQNAPTRL